MLMPAGLIGELLRAPDSQLDNSLKDKIRAWSNPPKAIEILEVLDFCIFGGMASGFVVRMLEMFYEEAIKEENTTEEEVVKLATWRGKW